MRRIAVQRRETIFDSNAETKLFRELESRWSPKLRLFAQTPLRNLLEISDADLPRLKSSHKAYFRSASVDFTFADEAGRPLLSIEFDGIGGGFGRGKRYVPKRTTPDPNRKWKMDFKLSASASANFPLFVVSFEEIEPFEEKDSITIVDGIVGQLLSRQEERRLVQEMVDESQDQLERLSPSEADELIQDLAVQASVLSDFEHDPLAIAVAEEGEELFKRFGLGTGVAHEPWLHDPPLPDTDSFPPSPEILQARIKGMNEATRVGGRVGVATGAGDYVFATVWMRNIGQEHGLVPALIAEQLAHLCALRRLREAVDRGNVAEVAQAHHASSRGAVH